MADEDFLECELSPRPAPSKPEPRRSIPEQETRIDHESVAISAGAAQAGIGLPGDEHDDLPGSAGEHLLQCAYGSRARARKFYTDQVLEHLNPAMIEFVGRMEMAFVATADSTGECDSSLRAGAAGFIQVLDEHHIAYPEYRGNGVLASLGNIDRKSVV